MCSRGHKAVKSLSLKRNDGTEEEGMWNGNEKTKIAGAISISSILRLSVSSLSVSLSTLADSSLVAFLKSRRGGNESQKKELKMEQNRPEKFVESLPVAQCGVGSSLSMQESGLEESVRKEENMKAEIIGKKQSPCC